MVSVTLENFKPDVYTNIYIHIVIHRRIFSLYHKISVWLKPATKTDWSKVSWVFYPRAIVIASASEVFFLRIYFYIYAISYQSAQFMRIALHLRICCSWQSPTRVINPVKILYIYIYKIFMFLTSPLGEVMEDQMKQLWLHSAQYQW